MALLLSFHSITDSLGISQLALQSIDLSLGNPIPIHADSETLHQNIPLAAVKRVENPINERMNLRSHQLFLQKLRAIRKDQTGFSQSDVAKKHKCRSVLSF